MDNDQITALAREYADMLKHLFPDMPEHTYRDKMSQAKNVINIIMRRFCLVEKSEVERIYNLNKRRLQATHGLTSASVVELLESLFPEIAKEVEG